VSLKSLYGIASFLAKNGIVDVYHIKSLDFAEVMHHYNYLLAGDK
jgi:hypothetical protein